ncbi:UDP-2,3-diacylglucosamine diphosphatase [Neisseria leonii]|uniref:UDP-2,3-diacylglucosamine hydrolase n=1 Tax=Neisseria leonii TaxID=2995413 RepID=A0A9X4E3Z9_9NEIS|nr:UDP-2,3-diacylglucosamine diphosphatase [Neisseria sp. 51.81]MDD9327032.1 UDP-2,3-diacylglucosamine diphosphatase [Neisseria sp. 51.81]
MRPVLLIADLHLSDDTPDLNRLFLQFLHHWQGRAQALYILGDLFEAWLGDDVLSGIAREAAAALKTFGQSAPVYFICGNRDFLLGRRYAEQAGMILLPEVHSVVLHGKNCLLSHGDEMCTDDKAYQRFRCIMRRKWLQKILLSLPKKQRAALAEKMRRASRARQQAVGQSAVSDVTEQGVQTAWRQYPHIEAVIHGHTHRPAVHHHQNQGRSLARYVVPDWYGGKGGYVAVTPQHIAIHYIELDAV